VADRQTHRQTDHATRSATIARIYALLTVKKSGKLNKRRSLVN